MTREENLHWIDQEIQTWENECQSKHPIKEALHAARKALEQEPCEDAVSRKAVHDMLENLPVTVEDKWFNWLQKACMRLAELPPATPQQPRKLEQEQDKPMVEIDLYSVIKQKYIEREVLDEIRAEISKTWHTHPQSRYEEGLKDQALRDIKIIDRYKAETENT